MKLPRLSLLTLAGALAATGLSFAAGSTITTQLTAAKIDYLFPLTTTTSNTLHNAQAIGYMYKGLFHVGNNGAIDYARSVASSITSSDGGLLYTIKLNPKWHWSTGQPVTAQDVVFTWSLINADCNRPNGAGTYAACGQGGIGAPGKPPTKTIITSVKAVGKYEVQVRIDTKTNPLWFEYNGLGQFEPLPKFYYDKFPGHPAKTYAYWTSHGGDVSLFTHAPIDGAFRVVKLVQGQEYDFARNSKYNGHMPSYQNLVIKSFTSSDAEFNALKAGEIDVGFVPTHLYAEHKISGYKFFTTPVWGFNYIYVNFANPAAPYLKSLTVRKALQMAIDQPAIVKAIFHGLGAPQYGPIPLFPRTQYVSPNILAGNPYPYNPAEGKKLLEQAGWTMHNGVMTKGKEKLAFTMLYTSGVTATQLQDELLQAAAAKEGIKITLAPAPFDTLIGDLNSPKKWVLMDYGGVSQGAFPSMHGIFACHSGFNQQGYCDPTADALMKAASQQYYPSIKQTLQAFYNAENYLSLQLPVLYQPINFGLQESSRKVKGVQASFQALADRFAPQYWSLR